MGFSACEEIFLCCWYCAVNLLCKSGLSLSIIFFWNLCMGHKLEENHMNSCIAFLLVLWLLFGEKS